MYRNEPFAGDTLISRKHKVENVLSEAADFDGITISAQAGQGKSIFASFILAELTNVYIRYQLTEKDREPLHLCIGLHTLLKEKLPGYSSPELDELIKQKTMIIFEYGRYAGMIAEALAKLEGRYCIIIDDLHILPSDGLGLHCLCTFLGRLTFNITPIICSRRNISLKTSKRYYAVDGSYLRLDKAEFMMLCNACLTWLCDFGSIEKILEITDGWVMGVRLIFDYMTKHNITNISHIRSMEDVMSKYFNVLDADSKASDRKGTVRLLALLEDFHTDMVLTLPDGKTALQRLKEMHDHNFFVYEAGEGRYTYHHLFAEYLSANVKKNLSSDDIARFLKSAADFELQRGEYSKALKYLADAGDLSGIESAMMNNLADIRELSSVKYIYETVTKAVVGAKEPMPVTYLFMGMQAEQDGNIAAFDYLTASAVQAEQTGDKLCESLAVSCLVKYLAYIGGDFELAASYHKRLLELYDEHADIHPEFELIINTALAVGAIFTYGDADPLPYLDRVEKLNKKQKSFSTEFSTITLKAMWAQFMSDSATLSEGSNELYEIHGSAVSNLMTDVFCLGHIINHYGLKGELQYLYDVCCEIIDETPSPILKVFITTWLADNILSEGNAEKAMEIIDGFYKENSAPDHPDSQLMHTKALVYAVNGETEKAMKALEISLEKRQNSGAHKFFYILSNSFAAETCALVGEYELAEKYADAMQMDFTSPAFEGKACFIRAYICHHTGRFKEAAEYAVKGIEHFRSEQIKYFWGMVKDIYMPGLRYTVKNQSTAEYASEIARERFGLNLSADAEIPCININTMNRLELSCGGKKVSSESMGGMLHSLIAMLVCSTDMTAPVQCVMGTLWSDVSYAKARNCLDASVSRIRSIIKAELGLEPKQYVTVKNGQISLKNVIVDSAEFINLIYKTRRNYINGKYVESFMMLRRAEALYKGAFMDGYSGAVDVSEYASAVESSFFTMVSYMLFHEVRLRGLSGLDRTVACRLKVIMKDQETFRSVVSHYKKNGDTMLVLKLLDKYAEYLAENEFDEYEISKAIFELKKDGI
jgi:ATP/maltotriose-dependent transcriptional regulator MalT